jgi:Holliday junction resolvase RusA-like endonuclease
MSELSLIHDAPTASSVEIVLDLPMPTSTNRLYGRGTGKPWGGRRRAVYRSAEYVRWMEEADMTVMADKAYPKRKIAGSFGVMIMLSREHRGDGDNRIKAALDWLQSRDIVRNDSNCQTGVWLWVEPELAPRGCRVVLKGL